MIGLDLFNEDSLDKTALDVTKYVNSNVECIIRVLLDYIENDDGFDADSFIPYNNLKISSKQWIELLYNLYDIVRRDTIHYYIKPKYEYLLYIILQWWDEVIDDNEDIMPQKLANDLAEKIKSDYSEEEFYVSILEKITNFEDYFYILFSDYYFLPSRLEPLTMKYLNNPQFFEEVHADIDLKEYKELMPKDLQEQFLEVNTTLNESKKKSISEKQLLDDVLRCCGVLQANSSYKNFSEDEMNDIIRDLLTSSKYEVRDQTRQGVSESGKKAGEIDLLIKNDGKPCAIIEALKLECVNRGEISKHIDKIYGYDTIGHHYNFIISYVRVKKFAEFWGKYLRYVSSYSYPLEVSRFIPSHGNQNSELRYAISELKREGLNTRLYHIAVHIHA